MAEPKSIKDQAEAFRHGLIAGYVDPTAVTQWADALIAGSDSPDYAIVEATLHSSNRQQMAADLEGVKGEADINLTHGHTLNLLGRFLLEHPKQWRIVRDVLRHMLADFDYDDLMKLRGY